MKQARGEARQSGGATSAASPNLQGEDTVEESSLRECPFCGGEAEVGKTFFGLQDMVKCRRGCGAMIWKAEAEAIAVWNTRPQSITVTEEMIELLTDARYTLWHALDHLNVANPDESPTIMAIDAALSKVSPLA